MKFGLSTPQYQYLTENLVAPIKEKGFAVYCFGSRARGDQNPFSDIDLMIEGSITSDGQKLKSHI